MIYDQKPLSKSNHLVTNLIYYGSWDYGTSLLGSTFSGLFAHNSNHNITQTEIIIMTS